MHKEGYCDHYSTRNQKHQTPTTTELTARDVVRAVSHDKINSQLLSRRDGQYILAMQCSPKISLPLPKYRVASKEKLTEGVTLPQMEVLLK